jgi:hypothetical protein
MKRYRVLDITFDARASILKVAIDQKGEPRVRSMWEQNRAIVTADLERQFGQTDFPRKLERFVALGAAPFSGALDVLCIRLTRSAPR